MFNNKSLETRLAESEQAHQKTTGFLTAVCTFLITAFSLSKEQGEAVATGDTKPLESGIAALSKPFKDLCASLVVAFKVSTADVPKFFISEGDDKPSPLIASITSLQTESASLGSLRGFLGKALDLKPDEVAALDDEAKVIAAVDKVAGKKAVAIAAAQGTPTPIPTKPGAAGDEDEVAALRTQASEEKDPIKRAQLHAKADRLANQKKQSDNN